MNNLANEVTKHFSDKKICMLSLQDSIDYEICKKFGTFLNKNGIKNTKIMSNLNYEGVINTIANLEYLIAMRFHANVIGIKAKIKTIPIDYDPKVEKLAEEYNLPYIQPNETDLNDFFSKID
ncbi:polysaccharide pyruvyl transferase family protein [bacterium]|nr:polysaccharide pyruvyl transferase family protein [bacterium]